MQICINNKVNANLPFKIAEINATALYDTRADTNYMSYGCFSKLNILHH